MIAIKDTSAVPEEGWQFFVPKTGYTVTTRNYGMLYQMVVRHYKSNQIAPIPTEQEVIDYVCANGRVSCYETETREPLINKFSFPSARPVTNSCCGSVTKIDMMP